MESNNVLVLHSLQQYHLIIHHLLIALDILLKDDLDSISLAIAFCLPYDAVRSSTQGSSKSVLCSMVCISLSVTYVCRMVCLLLVVTIRLAGQLVHHV